MMASKISLRRIIGYTCFTLLFLILEAPLFGNIPFQPGWKSTILYSVMVTFASVLTMFIVVFIYALIKKMQVRKVDFLGIFIFLFFAFIAMIVETPILLQIINIKAGYFYSTMFVVFALLVPILTAYSLIWILGYTYNLSHDQWRNGIIHCLLLFNVITGLLYSLNMLGNDPSIIMIPAIISYFIVVIILVFYQIPPVMIVAMIVSILIYIPSSLSNGNIIFGITNGPPADWINLIPAVIRLGSGGALSCVLVLSVVFTCVYYPRRLQFSRYFMPQYRIYGKKANHHGFTLIELLIVVAVMGIMAAAYRGYIGQSIQSARDYKERVCIAQILSSEMEYLLQNTVDAAVVSDQPVPIPLSEFKINFPLTAAYHIEEVSDTPGLMKITVTAVEKLNEETNKNYRLVSLKRARK